VDQDFIAELETKVTALIDEYGRIKKENEKQSQELDALKNRIQELEGENGTLKKEMHALKDMSAGQQKKLDTAAQKVKELIVKLEAVA